MRNSKFKKWCSLCLGLIAIVSAANASGQKHPSVYMAFTGHDQGAGCHNSLILSTDSTFFQVGECEKDTRLVKGKWRLLNNELTLTRFDSTNCLPHMQVTYSKYRSADSLHFDITDYFGKPFPVALVIYSAGEGDKTDQQTITVDSKGKATIKRQMTSAFVMQYIINSPELAANLAVDTLSNKTNNIRIKMDYPRAAGLDREVFVIGQGDPTARFLLDKGKLYDTDDKTRVLYDKAR